MGKKGPRDLTHTRELSVAHRQSNMGGPLAMAGLRPEARCKGALGEEEGETTGPADAFMRLGVRGNRAMPGVPILRVRN